jgi:hypothetical protein
MQKLALLGRSELLGRVDEHQMGISASHLEETLNARATAHYEEIEAVAPSQPIDLEDEPQPGAVDEGGGAKVERDASLVQDRLQRGSGIWDRGQVELSVQLDDRGGFCLSDHAPELIWVGACAGLIRRRHAAN